MQPPKLTQPPVPITHEREALRLVLYGEPGVGKTTLAMSFPRPIVLNADDGLVAVTTKDPKATLGQKVDVQGYGDLMGLYFYVREHAAEWDTFVIDSIDELAFILTEELITRANEYDIRKKGSGYDPHPTFEFIPEQGEYQANQRQLHKFLKYVAGIGKHVVVTSGVRALDPPRVTKRGPNLAPGARADLIRWSSLAGELVIADDGRGLIVRNGDPVRESKDRLGVGPVVADPTFGKLWTPSSTKGAKSNAVTR